MSATAGSVTYQGKQATGLKVWMIVAAIMAAALSAGLLVGRVTAPTATTTTVPKFVVVPATDPFPAAGERAANRASYPHIQILGPASTTSGPGTSVGPATATTTGEATDTTGGLGLSAELARVKTEVAKMRTQSAR